MLLTMLQIKLYKTFGNHGRAKNTELPKKWIYGKHRITFLSEGSTLSKTHFLFKLNFLTGHSMDRT